MRKPVQMGLIAAVVVLLAATTFLFVRNQQTNTAYTNIKASEETTRNRYSETIDAIAEIQDSLNSISLGDTNVRMLSDNLSSENRSQVNSQDALERIAAMRESIRRSKDRIRQLESSLSKSGNKVAGLQRMVTNLKRGVKEKEELVAQLTTQVEALQTQVTGLQTEVAQTQDTVRVRDVALEERRRDLATVYYVVGDKKMLKEAGVIEAKGGLLGLGKTVTPTGRFEVAATPIDTDQETVIPTPATKPTQVKVLTPQAPSSYELRLVDGQMQLHILDPIEFRKVKKLVIMTA